MIRRPWIILVTLLILFLAFSGVVTFRYLNRSHALRDRILTELSALEGTFSLNSASLSPNSLILNGLSYTDPDSAISFRVDRVSLRASVTNLLQHQGKLQSVLESISLTRPRVIVRLDHGGSPDDSAGFKLPSLTDWSALARVILLDGSVSLLTGEDDRWLDLHNLEGWLMGGAGRDMDIRLSGALHPDSTGQFDVSGRGNLADPSLNLRMTLKPLDLTNVVLPASAPVYGLAGELQATADAMLDSSGMDLSAQWTLGGGTIVIDEFNGLVVDEVNASGLVEDDLATVQGDFRFQGDEARFHGNLNLTGDPILHASTELDSVQIGYHLGVFAELARKHQPRGTFHTTADFSIDLTTGRMDLVARGDADSLWTPGGVFDDITMDYSWDNRRWELRFDDVRGSWYGLDVQGNGRFRPSQQIQFLVNGNFEGTGNSHRLPAWTKPIEGKSAKGDLLIRNLPVEGLVISGDARVRNGSNPAFGEFHGRYSRYGYDARLDLYSLSRPDAMARVTHSTDGPVHLVTEQPHQVLDWWEESIAVSDRLAELAIDVRGMIDNDSLIAVTTVKDPNTQGNAKLNTMAWLEDGGRIQLESGYRLGRDTLFVGNGELGGSYLDGTATVDTFTFLDEIGAQGVLNTRDWTVDRGQALINGLDLGHLLPALTSLDEGRVAGEINGRVQLDGPLKRPNLAANLDLSGGKVKDLSGYWGLLALDTDSSGLIHVRQGALGRQETTLFTLLGDYSAARDNLDLYLEHPGSDASVIFNTLAGREDLVHGDARFRATIAGPLLAPSWSLDLGMEQGTLGGIAFDEALVGLRGQTSDRIGHVVYVDTCRLVQPGSYSIEVAGAAPLSRGAGDLEITLEGNLLATLPQLSSFITEADGEGTLHWITTIVGGEPVASQGELRLSDGTMSFADLFPSLTDLNVAVTVDALGQAKVEQVSATLANNYPFEVRNNPGNPADSTRQAIRFGLPEINLGVLEVRTLSERGVPFRLPGISVNDNYARLKITGKQTDWLTIAGPADSLYVDGEISLLEARFTYPPILEGEETDILNVLLPQGAIFPNDPGMASAETPDFISNARWDVDAYVGTAVEYERIVKGLENAPFLESLSGFLGQLVLNLDLEPTEVGRPVKLSGSLADESFRLDGTVASTTGQIEVLDLLFEMDRAEVVFDRSSIYPLVSMRATTTIVEEDTPRQMSMTLYVIDPITGERQQRGRWGEFTFVLEDELGSSQEEVLSAMGVGIADITQLQNRLLISGAGGIDRAVARRYLAPLEREAADWLGLDLVQVRPQFATNLVGPNPSDLWIQPTAEDDQRIAANTGTANLFRGSRLMMGKYINQDVFISYTGQFGEDARYASVADIQLGRLGLLQKWNLEYRLKPISPNFVIELGWEYESVEDQNNRSARVKYSVLFDLMALNSRSLWRTRF